MLFCRIHVVIFATTIRAASPLSTDCKLVFFFILKRRQFCWYELNCLQNSNISDIPFNFLIGGDGKTYEIRGWNYLSGFNEMNYNEQSFVVALIGDFTYNKPSDYQIKEVEALISESVRRRKLSSNYQILGFQKSKRDGHEMFKKLRLLDGWVGWIWILTEVPFVIFEFYKLKKFKKLMKSSRRLAIILALSK